MAEINNALALATKPPEIDFSTPLLTASRLRAAENQNALTQLTIKEHTGKQNALADYSERARAGDPKAADALISHPEIYAQVVQVRNSIDEANRKRYDDNLMRNAKGAMRVASISDPTQRSAAWQEELETARKEGRIDAGTYKNLAGTQPNELVLSNIIRAGLSLEQAITLEQKEKDRGATKSALGAVAAAYGGPANGNGNIDAPAAATPRMGGPVPSSSKVWGDKEAEDAGLYEPAPGAKTASASSTPALPSAKTAMPAGADDEGEDRSKPSAGTVTPVASSPAAAATMPGIGNTNRSRIPLLIAAAGMPGIPAETRAVNLELLKQEIGRETGEMKNYGLYAAQEIANGRTPTTFESYELRQKEANRSQVNIDQRAEGSFANEFGKKQADRWNAYITEADRAREKLVDIRNMREISSRAGSQGAAADWKETLGPYAEAFGINLDGLSDVQAFSSIIERLAPQQRAVGSGSTSDIEYKGFKKSLPVLAQNPQAREITLDTMEAIENDRVARGEIATRLATKEITRSEAEKELRGLPDPMTKFRQWKKDNPQLYQQAIKAGNEVAVKPAAVKPAAAPAAQAAQPKASDMTAEDIAQSLANAKAAIAKNPAVRDAVIERLKASGISTGGL